MKLFIYFGKILFHYLLPKIEDVKKFPFGEAGSQ